MKSRLSIFFVLCLVVAACGGDGEDTTTTTAASADETTTTAGTDETTTTAGDSSTTAGDTSTTTGAETSTTAGGSAGGDNCLVGSWVLDDQAFFDQVFAEEDEEAAFGEVTSVSGEFTTTFNANGSVEAVRDDWGFSVVTDEGTFNIVINGTQTGTWETEGSTLLLTLDEGDTFEVEASVIVDGEEIELPSDAMEVPAEALSSSSEFSCSGDDLTVTSEGITSEFDRT